MTVTEDELEERAVARRVTMREIENSILFCHYFTAGQAIRSAEQLGSFPLEGQMEPLERLTFCVLTLKNGFTILGKSACASPENYQQDIGERIARENAIEQLWEPMGFALCSKLTGVELI